MHYKNTQITCITLKYMMSYGTKECIFTNKNIHWSQFVSFHFIWHTHTHTPCQKLFNFLKYENSCSRCDHGHFVFITRVTKLIIKCSKCFFSVIKSVSTGNIYWILHYTQLHFMIELLVFLNVMIYVTCFMSTRYPL